MGVVPMLPAARLEEGVHRQGHESKHTAASFVYSICVHALWAPSPWSVSKVLPTTALCVHRCFASNSTCTSPPVLNDAAFAMCAASLHDGPCVDVWCLCIWGTVQPRKGN